MPDVLSSKLLNDWPKRTWEERCLSIIDYCSPWNAKEIAEALGDARDGPKVTFGKLEISATDCERDLRYLLNDKVRDPRGLDRYAPGAIKQSTKVLDVIEDCCADV